MKRIDPNLLLLFSSPVARRRENETDLNRLKIALCQLFVIPLLSLAGRPARFSHKRRNNYKQNVKKRQAVAASKKAFPLATGGALFSLFYDQPSLFCLDRLRTDRFLF